MTRHPRSTFLHRRFSIQATVHSYIGISDQLGIKFEKLRINNTNKNELGFILEELKIVGTEAWKLLPQYGIHPHTGEWRHQSNSLAKECNWLDVTAPPTGRCSSRIDASLGRARSPSRILSAHGAISVQQLAQDTHPCDARRTAQPQSEVRWRGAVAVIYAPTAV